MKIIAKAIKTRHCFQWQYPIKLLVSQFGFQTGGGVEPFYAIFKQQKQLQEIDYAHGHKLRVTNNNRGKSPHT